MGVGLEVGLRVRTVLTVSVGCPEAEELKEFKDDLVAAEDTVVLSVPLSVEEADSEKVFEGEELAEGVKDTGAEKVGVSRAEDDTETVTEGDCEEETLDEGESELREDDVAQAEALTLPQPVMVADWVGVVLDDRDACAVVDTLADEHAEGEKIGLDEVDRDPDEEGERVPVADALYETNAEPEGEMVALIE